MERRRIEASTSSPSAPPPPSQPLNPTPLTSNESRVFDFPAEADPLAPSGSGGADTIGGEKKRRGRPKRQAGVAAPRAPPPKRQAVRKRQAVVPETQPMEADEDVWEDICFICFDGGSLVLCDFKGCPKAYHPACIKRDETYFQSKGKWNCGWHICSVCQRASHYMCYTCTYSLCKGCIKETDYVCVRGNMGLCKVCMKTIMLIENKDQANEESVKVDFDDITSWEYLFKLYWIYLKQSISLTLHEITQAKHLSQGVGSVACKQKLRDLRSGVNYEHEQITNGQSEQFNLKDTKDLEQSPSSGKITENGAALIRCKEWASKELLEFVGHVKDGDTCVLSQFDVLELLLKYIKKNGLLDRDYQVVCDSRLTNLFGKPRVSQSEMLKLLECHLLLKDEPPKNSSTQAEMVGTASTNLEHSENKESSITQQNSCKKFDVGIPQNNLDEYAAIDAHNMNLIYLPRNLMGSLIQDEKFHEKVVGSIVRIRISNSDQKQDMYRLVPVRGSNKGPEPYKLGNKRVDTMLEVLNLDKKESIAIDAISDQEFSPDECRHLREIIKCGLVKPFTVGEVRKKAMELLSVRLDERLDAEILKLNQLCDQTSEQERIKELRIRISKLELLKTPEECQRRFSGMIQVHTDPKMSPDYDSEQDADQKPKVFTRSKSSEFDRSDCRHNSSEREEVSTRSKSSEFDRSDCRHISSEREEVSTRSKSSEFDRSDGRHNSSEREEVFTRSKSSELDRSDCRHNSSEREEVFTSSKSSEFDRSDCRHSSSEREVKDEGLINGQNKVDQKRDGSDLGDQAVSGPGTEISAAAHEMESSSPMNESETEKLWYYRDPNDKIQGPFSIVQLREWSKTGYFPPDMKIWTIYEHEDSILLTEALNGQFHTAAHLLYNFSLQSHQVRGSNRISDTGSDENKDNSRRDNLIDGTLKAGTGLVQCRKSSETGGSDVMGGNSGVQSSENNKSGRTDVLGSNNGVQSGENNELGRTDVLGDPSGMKSRDNNGYRKINVIVDTGSQSRENNEPGKTDASQSRSCGLNLKEMQPGHSPPQNYEPGKTDASLSESCDITASGLIPKDMQPAPHSPPQKYEPGKTDASLSESCGFTASGLIPKEMQPRHSRRRKLKEHTSSSTHHQIHQLPSPTNGTSHFSPHQGGGRGSEGYSYSPNHEKQESDVSAVVQAAGQSHENKSNAKSNENQSFGQNRRSFPINLNSKGIDLNSGLSPATNSDSSKQSCDMELPELPNRMPKEGNREPETDSAENSQLSLDVHPMPDPTSPMLKLSNESQVAHATEYKPPPSLKVEQDFHPSRSSSLVVGGAQFQNIANDWGGYSQQPIKPVLEGWSSGLVSSSSLKQHEFAGVHAAPTANIDPLAHISACNPTPSTSSWHGIVEPIEFISLAEESVSDLLAEVDAMESQGGGLASPTSAMRYEDEMMKFCKNECFTIEDFSPTHNPGRSDALSSTRDIQLPSQSTATQEPVGASEGNIYDTPKRSSRHSSNNREREARPSDVRVNHRDAAHPGLSLSMSQDINSAVPPSSRMDSMDSGIMGRAPDNINPFWGVPPQGINNPGYATYQGTSYGNSNTNRSTHNTNGGLQWDGQRKYAGERHPAPRDHATHGSDVGYSSRGRPSYNRQSFGGGGGYTRSPKGQRVCKFYESGHCRKGASCEYLHP